MIRAPGERKMGGQDNMKLVSGDDFPMDVFGTHIWMKTSLPVRGVWLEHIYDLGRRRRRAGGGHKRGER